MTQMLELIYKDFKTYHKYVQNLKGKYGLNEQADRESQ